MDDLKVAAVCMEALPGEVERNLKRVEALVLEASAENARFVCFPELSVTGYTLKRPAHIHGNARPEEAVDRLVCLAKQTRLVLIAGLAEIQPGSRPYITQVVAGPEGLLGLYRKTHLSPPEKNIYQPGHQIKAFSFGHTTFGVQLCYEAHFPEISTTMALMGAEILFFPHASPRGSATEKLQSWMRHLPARAYDNSVFVVACNQVGKSGDGLFFPGVAMVVGPDGRILASYAGEEEKILYAELKADRLQRTRKHRMRYFLPERRPELYKKIVSAAKRGAECGGKAQEDF